ncbi:MAG: AzlD domain-containing protein [Acidimicrobiia bacterium]
MSDATIVLVVLGLGTYALKAAGPVLIGGRRLPAWMNRLTDLAPAALLAGLVATSTFARSGTLVVDARLAGLITAIVAQRLKAPFFVMVVLAAAATALVRSLG